MYVPVISQIQRLISAGDKSRKTSDSIFSTKSAFFKI